MKSPLLFLPLLFLQLPLTAQVTEVVRPGSPETVTITTVPPRAQPLDSMVVRRQLSIAPRVMAATPAVPVAPATQAPVVEKITRTTTTVDTPGEGRRVYNVERHVVTVQDQNQTRELPYVTLPVLFVKETAELLDQESRSSLDQMAGVIKEVIQAEPGATFEIEGHTSTDGADDFNLTLSGARAQRVYDELTQHYGIPPGVLTGHGYGERFPQFPNGTEEQMQQDRRVLVVRTK
ncbi:MAG: hypothetical protein JWO94_2814 [Verrucomicrobiaceae bacterium]|nr:hypothetical protein [Verrucomicrobiaceae bacterium]